MTIRPSRSASSTSDKLQRQRRQRLIRRRTRRDLRLESLEDRRVMAGLQLAGITSNQGALVHDGAIFNVSPTELALRFNTLAELDAASLASGIEIIRSGGDGTFQSAGVRTDLNTNGAVLMDFSAVQPGSAGEGLQLVFTKNDRGAAGGVGITVEGATIRIDLNTNAAARTTAASLRDAVNSHVDARQLIRATVLRGNSFTVVSTPAINYSPLTLRGANQARGSSNFNQGTALEVEFSAMPAGIAGNGITLAFTQVNLGLAAAPRITLNGRTLNIQLNSTPGSETTAAALVTAINTDPVANQLVRARLTVGQGSTRVTSSQNIAPVTLTGANDVVLTPGFVGLGATPNVGVFRFAETLVDDVYRINLLGRASGSRGPIQGVDGDTFLGGTANQSLSFELDLGAQVLSVVPQPIVRQSNGSLVQLRDQVHVYFNDDDLDRAQAENPNFYELIKTNDTVRNTDDVSFHPVSVQYDAAADRAVLTFARPLDELDLGAPGAATFRLRIGTDEALPLAPATFTPNSDPGSSFTTALDLTGTFETGAVLSIVTDGSGFNDGQTFSVTNRQGVTRTFEFNDTVGGPGGVTSGNVAVPYSKSSAFSRAAMAQAIATAINGSTLNVQAVVNGTNVLLTNDAAVNLPANLRGMSKASQALIISGSITNAGQPYELNFPGDILEPGHRDIPVETHLLGAADALNGITQAFYNFQPEYGFDPQGNVLRNAITDVQKERVREIFALYGRYLGIQFVESASLGMTIAVGDMRALDPQIPTGKGGVLGLAGGGLNGLAIMDLQDFDTQNDEFGGEFFQTAMHEIGHLLTLGHTYDLPAITIMGDDLSLPGSSDAEPVFPGDHDIVHGQHLYRPESKDIDLYRFEVTQRGLFTAETIAERLANSSQLDTALALYRQTATGRELVARNDDYFSHDSALELILEPGVYFLGVSASGNNEYDPSIEDSGIGGRTEGEYQLRVNFRGEVTNAINDVDNASRFDANSLSRSTPLDGDGDGVPGGVYNTWLRVQRPSDTIIVDKASTSATQNGTLAAPFKTISAALAAAAPGDIVRIVGNGGADGDITTLEDNRAYEIGFSALNGTVLADGANLQVPKGVTVMVDAGAVIKARRSYIGVGSLSPVVDNSGGALQILGTPRVLDAAGQVRRDAFGQPIVGHVIVTSLHDTIGVGVNPHQNPPAADEGDWGGIIFDGSFDETNPNRVDLERQGTFLNSVTYANLRFGGGTVIVDGNPTVVDPIFINDTRPTVAYSTITNSAHAAISANPDSFEETNFHAPEYQISGAFTSDYTRSGPEIQGNRVTNNTLNGLFVRTRTRSSDPTESLTVAGRFDDTDIVHILQENLNVLGTPGGPVLEGVAPPVNLVTVAPGTVGGALPPGTFNYRITFVDANGNESPPSNVTLSATVPGNPDIFNQTNIGTVLLSNLPTVPQGSGYVARRVYRSTPGGTGPYTLAAQINGFDTTFLDSGSTAGGQLNIASSVLRARLDARLRIDAGTVVKSESAIIDVGIGANLIAEGTKQNQIVMTSLADSRYGRGGTFVTNSPNGSSSSANAGDWGGIFASHDSSISIDHATIAYGGGTARIEGGFRGFNTIEVHQADARIANSTFEFNDSGVFGDPDDVDSREGRGFNTEAVIFVRASQPVVVNNTFIHNNAAVLSANANALNSRRVNDLGRSTGLVDIYPSGTSNFGPLVNDNRLDDNSLNGMVVRGGTLTTESVWDDTDIVHIVFDTVTVPDFHTFGGLRLNSKVTESLVVKLSGSQAGFTATGRPLDINDRIGGSLHVIGQPGFPVIFTTLTDDSAGAGFRPDGTPQTDTNNADESGGGGDGGPTLPTGPEVNNGTLIDNDVDPNTTGFFSFRAENGGNNSFGGGGGVTVDGTSGQLVNQDFIFDFLNFVDVGAGGSALNLATTAITQPATLESDDLVASEGTFAGANGPVQWRAESFFDDGIAKLVNRVTFTSEGPLGALRLINYLDEDVFGPNDDLMLIQGTPGQPDFRVFTLDNAERVGFSHGGVYVPGPDLVNATYEGWAADQFPQLRGDIAGNGTQFTVAGNIDTTDITPFTDPELGPVFGLTDVTTAFSWQVDPNSNTATITTFLELIAENPVDVIGGQAGDWRSLRLEEYSNDRNVEVLNELEPVDAQNPGSNGTPVSSEFLGELAANEKSGDDNVRLGFTVHGNISNPQDVDVYRFTGRGGTEVWLDIDRTTHSLDTVIELVDASGRVLARSDNSVEEALDPSLLVRDPAVPSVNILQKSTFEGEDRYTTNPRDAGMRLTLPGAVGSVGTYYVRVRSSSPNLNNLSGGLTQGSYQLQVRLRERDEFAGSTIRYADIRFATNGIEVFGQPIHSPLAGEVGEDASPNDTLDAAQLMGNFMVTDRAALGIAGNLSSSTDIDFFQFEAIYEDTSPSSVPRYVATTFDMDYADGLGRPNTVLSIFDSNGNLVLVADNSNVRDDQPGPLSGPNMDDLQRGSAGPLDPFLGTVMLPEGTYFAAITAINQIPTQLGQFQLANPTNPLARLEPVNSIRRIAEDHINSTARGTFDTPQVPVLFDDSSAVPWMLGDMTLYVSQDPGTIDQTNLYTVNPFTGQRQTQVGRFNFDVGDIAIRPNGDLMSYSLDLENFPFEDAAAGIYFQIDTGTGQATVIGASGIQTFEVDPANPAAAVRSNNFNGVTIGDGIHFDAITFGNLGDNVERGFAVGARPQGADPLGINATRNLLYEFIPATGTATSFPANDRTGGGLIFGAGTQIVERRRLLTDADPDGLSQTALITPEATEITSQLATTPIILDGTRFAVDNNGALTQFEFVSGPEVQLNLAPNRAQNPIFLRDGDTFFLDGQPFEFDTGEVLIVTAANGNFINDGDRFSVTDNQGAPVTRVFEWDNGTGPTIPSNVIPVQFNVGMSRAALVAQVVNAINGQTQFDADGNPIFAASAQALPTIDANFSNRISLINSTNASETSTGMTIEGNTGLSTSRAVPNPLNTPLIRVEEVYDNFQAGDALELAFNGLAGPPPVPGIPNIEVGADGNRVNFVGPTGGSFTELVNRGAFTNLNHDNQPSALGIVAVPFLADDTADEIAQRIAAAVNGVAGLSGSATANGPVVRLAGGAIFDAQGTDDPPLTIAGSAPGGDITGTAFIGSQMYAVSDNGGLYRILNAGSAGAAQADYIETSTDLLNINFQGLTAGPRNLQGGQYSDLLFGIDANGRLYAFNTQGVLQPVFVNGATFIDTGVTNANGIEFSTLDTNLWHRTNNRNADAGHGINEPFDRSRQAVNGNNSLWFGWESQTANNVQIDPFFNPVNNNADYNFPGGAHGSLVSNSFDLSGYTFNDAPTLYFNYRLETENASAVLNAGTPQFMRDAFRVFAAGDDGVWHLLATNNSGRSPGGGNDEYDEFTPQDGIDVEVQELYDVGDNGAPDSWRQARISLAPFAGQSNLRLRFDFSTAGEMDTGDPNSTGSYLHAISGAELRDGQRVLIDNDAFEFDLGYTLVAPSGAAIREGDTLTIHGQVFEFDLGDGVQAGRTAIPYNAGQSASAVALAIRSVLANAGFSRTGDLTLESNDTLAGALNTGLLGGADHFFSTGVIGDNASLAVPGLDVDLVRLNLNAGDHLLVDVRAATGSNLNAAVRLFNSAGVPLALNDNPGGQNAQLDLTIGASGTYYLGVSGSPNTAYSPLTAGSGVAGSTGAYELEISVNGFTGITPRLHDNRIQLDGASKVSQTPGAALILDGASGISGGAVTIPVHADMTAAQVAAAIQQALANRYAGGATEAFNVDRNRVQVVGHTVASPGPLGLTNTLFGDQFGAFEASTRFDGTTDANNPGALRAQNNDFEGVYIDDIIIGFAERGEMVTGGNAGTTFINNVQLPANQILAGDYQLEIRRSQDYGIGDPPPVPELILTNSFDTNERLNQSYTLNAPSASEVVDGQTFQISDGTRTVVFEFEDINIGNGVAPGRIAIPFDPSANQAGGGVGAESAVVMARRIRDAINSAPVQAVLRIRAGLSDGTASGTNSTDAQINLYGNVQVGAIQTTVIAGDLSAATEVNDTIGTSVAANVPAGLASVYRADGFIGDDPTLTGFNAALDVDLVEFQFTAGSHVRIDIDASAQGSSVDPMLRIFDVSGNELAFSDDNPAPGEPFTLDAYIDFIVPVTGTYYIGISSFFNRNYDITQTASGVAGGSTGPYTLEVSVDSGGIAVRQSNFLGDENLERDQGQLLIHSNRISNSQLFGINIDAGAREGAQVAPHQGPPRVTRELNSQRLVPGVVVENNVIYGNSEGAIRYSGDGNVTDQLGAVPFGRIINNTLFGGDDPTGVGILVENNASPTLLNNIVAGFAQGIDIDGTSRTAVIGGTLFKGNTNNSNAGTGSFALVLDDDAPLFKDAAAGNFYLADGSLAIDSGVNSLNDRPALVSVRSPLGIASSSIIAPSLDIFGQLRVDDPSVEPPPGAGQNPFIDRGAIDRADSAGPIALLIDPRDNDSAGADIDPRVTFVKLTTESLSNFSIQLRDGVEPIDPSNGIGVHDATVSARSVKVFRDGVLLQQDLDYRFQYDAVNNIIRLTPLVGLWETDHTYVIELANRDQFVLTAPAGDEISDGESFTLTDASGNTAKFEFESGYVINVTETLSLTMPLAGGGLGGMTDGQVFTINNGSTVVRFEFDNNGAVTSGNVRIIFTPQSSAEDLAAAVVTALQNAGIGLAPRNLGNGRVHVGTLPTYIVNTNNAPSLTRSGSEQGGVRDGDTFTLDDGTRVRTFEFDRNNSVQGSNTRIAFLQTDTHEDIAAKIVAAIRANTNLTPTDLGDGVVHLGGNLLTVLNTISSRLTQSGLPGVASEFGIRIPSIGGVPQNVTDGQTFRIGDGVGLPITFEFDTNNSIIPGNVRVQIPANATLNQIANAMVQAIGNAGLGLTVVNAGSGRVILNRDTANHFFEPLTSSLVQLGAPGVAGATAINFVPDDSFTAETMASTIAALINANTTLEGVTATVDVTEVVLDGVTATEGAVDAFVSAIRDLADNVLQSNQTDGSTKFVIQVGSGLDYGDAPDSYATTLAASGARHQVIPEFRLGELIDVDADGRPSVLADGDDNDGVDDEDGVTFGSLVRGFTTTITVNAAGINATRPGRLDAWIDFNADGDWNDAGEQIATSLVLVEGDNQLSVTIPGNAALGATYARFRLSSTGGLSPAGAAIDGEVEDYRIVIGSSPWQNTQLAADVSGDGRVNAFDVLVSLAFVQRYGINITLPNPPPLVVGGESVFPTGQMVDVDGNGRANLTDVLMVLSALQTGGSGEGEASAPVVVDQPEGEAPSSSLDAPLDAPLATPAAANLPPLALDVSAVTTVTTTAAPQSQPAAIRPARAVREVQFSVGAPVPVSQSVEIGDSYKTFTVADEDDLLEQLALGNNRQSAEEEASDAFFAELGR